MCRYASQAIQKLQPSIGRCEVCICHNVRSKRYLQVKVKGFILGDTETNNSSQDISPREKDMTLLQICSIKLIMDLAYNLHLSAKGNVFVDSKMTISIPF